MTLYVPLEEVKKQIIKIEESLNNIRELADGKNFKSKFVSGFLDGKTGLMGSEFQSFKRTISVNLGLIGRYLCRMEDIPTIDLSIIDTMIEEYTGTFASTDILIANALKELKQRLSTNK